jgi:hypothetical protein
MAQAVERLRKDDSEQALDLNPSRDENRSSRDFGGRNCSPFAQASEANRNDKPGY